MVLLKFMIIFVSNKEIMNIEFNLKGKCGVYIIFNTLNGKRYIGSSKDLYNRLYDHFYNLKLQTHHNRHLQAAYNKYGESNFLYCVLEFCEESLQYIVEQNYISFMCPEYNKSEYVIANTGREVNEETKNKISTTLKEHYKNGEITTYKQEHLWETTWLYNINTWELVGEYEYPTQALKSVGFKGTGYENFKTTLLLGKYIMSKEKFTDILSLQNYVFEHIYVAQGNKGKYIVSEKDSVIRYYRNITSCAEAIGVYKSTLYKHPNATEDHPYFTKTGYKFYYLNIFKPSPFLLETQECSGSKDDGEPAKENIVVSAKIA